MITANVLERINAPADVKRLDLRELNLLAEEVREDILRVTAKNGGHVATNLPRPLYQPTGALAYGPYGVFTDLLGAVDSPLHNRFRRGPEVLPHLVGSRYGAPGHTYHRILKGKPDTFAGH